MKMLSPAAPPPPPDTEGTAAPRVELEGGRRAAPLGLAGVGRAETGGVARDRGTTRLAVTPSGASAGVRWLGRHGARESDRAPRPHHA